MAIHPLVFKPILKPKLWGGRRLETVLNKKLPPGEPIGESWELADLETDVSVVASGPAEGARLSDMVRDWGPGLIGRAPLVDGRFPLLIKFLDAREALSVQVHPDAATARRMGGPVRVKHEAWYVVEADEGACIYRGLRPGAGRSDLREAITAGRVEEVLNRLPARKGHAYYLPSGIVHALGGGVLVAEVQTPSDVTFRLFDWGRVDAGTGNPRALHVEEGLGCVSTEPVPAEAEHPQHVASVWTSVTHLIRCPSFLLDRVRMVAGACQPIPVQEMVVWIVLDGTGSIRCKGLGSATGFGKGDTVLVPAGIEEAVVEAHQSAMWLEATVPIESSLAEFERPGRSELNEPLDTAGVVRLNVPGRAEPP